MDRESKIGQLFMVPASTYASSEEIDRITELIKDSHIGGLYITGGGPQSHVKLVNKIQKLARVPLLLGVSAEWGLAQSLDSTMGFQKPMVAASWRQDSLTQRWAQEIATQLKLLGFHMNFVKGSGFVLHRASSRRRGS